MSKVPYLSIRTGRLGLGAAVRRLTDVGRAVCDGTFSDKLRLFTSISIQIFLESISFAIKTTRAGQVCVKLSFA